MPAAATAASAATATVLLVAALHAFHATGGPFAAATAPVHEITVPPVPGQTYAVAATSVAAGSDGRLLLSLGHATAPLIVEYDLALGQSRYIAGNATTMISPVFTYGMCDFNSTLKATTADDPDPTPASVPLAGPTSIDAIGGEGQQVLVGNSMPASNLFWLGRASPFSDADAIFARRIAGQRCYFVQMREDAFIASLAATSAPNPPATTLARHFPPVSSLKYRKSTGELFVAFDRTIVVIGNAGAGIAHYYGNPTPLATPEPAPYDNRTTVIPVTKAPMDHRVHRLGAVSSGIGQMSILNDQFLVVPDQLHSAIRLVNFESGIVTAAASAPNGTQYWPPSYPCLDTPAGCPANNFTVFGASATATYGANAIFVAGMTFETLFVINTATGTVRHVAGRAPITTVDPTTPQTPQVFHGISSLAVASVTLAGRTSNLVIVAAHKGLFYINVSDVPDAAGIAPAAPLNTSMPNPPLCGVWSTCNGHATAAIGTPMTGCECRCKRGWSGPTCAVKPVPPLTATKTHSTSHPTRTKSLDLPLPVKLVVQSTVQDVATTSVVVTTTIAGVGTPTVATQGGRATVLLNLQVCEIELGEPFEFAESPTFLAVGTSDLRYAAGAVVGNYVTIGVILLLQYGFVMAIQWKKQLPLLEAQAFVRFPSIGAFPLLFTAEGTAYASTILLWHGTSDVSLRMLGVIGILGLVAMIVAVAVFMKAFFRATYELYPETISRMRRAEDASPDERASETLQSFVASNPSLLLTHGTLFERFQSLGRWLLDVKGKWRETGTHQTKRFGGIFMDYRPGMQAFAIVELCMAVGTGALAGLKPVHCRLMIILIMSMYIALFLLVVVLRPADNRYTKYMTTMITGLQALSSVLILAADVTNSAETANIARNVLFASMFIVGIMSFLDAATRIYHICKYVARTKGASRSSRVANATFIDGDEPLLERPTLRGQAIGSSSDPLQPGYQPPPGAIAGSILSHHPTPNAQPHDGFDPLSPRPTMGGRVQSAADFTNFSFTNANVTPPTPRGAGNAVNNNSALRTPTPLSSGNGAAVAGGAGSPSLSNASMATGTQIRRPNQTLEQLRAELDDLLTGRTQHSTRLDELLEAARIESSSSDANNSSMGRRQHSSVALTTPSTDRPPRYPSNRSLTGFAEALVRGNSTETFGGSSGTNTTNSSLVRRRGGAGGTYEL